MEEHDRGGPVIAAFLMRPFRPRAERDLHAAQRDDAAAIERLYETRVDELVYYRVGCDSALAEDAVQETFEIALTRRSLTTRRAGLSQSGCKYCPAT